jgi:hypothetical protein
MPSLCGITAMSLSSHFIGMMAVIINLPSLCGPPAINLPSLFITGMQGVITVLC